MKTPKLDTDQKALEINLNDQIFGTFAEIGAGQEVARYFFKVGAAAGTIVKTMSAYDKTFSDHIYGKEGSRRYVCESRLYKMLDHEYLLLLERLKKIRENKTFFVFADTVEAINYQKSNFGQGWLGLRFQLIPGGPPNELVLHARMWDTDSQLQASAIGILGVNMLYAAYYHYNDPESFVKSLHDHLKERISIDMIRVKGPQFDENWDNRLLSLYLVKNGLTNVAMFDETGESIQASEFLYRKSLMVVRGNYRPPTLVTEDVFDTSYDMFRSDFDIPTEKSEVMAELTLENLTRHGRIDPDDFMDRSEMIIGMGHKAIISNCEDHQKLIEYLSDFKINKLGVLIGIREFRDLIVEKYKSNEDGDLLVAFGQLFTKNLKVYVYPALNGDLSKIITLDNLELPQGIRFLFRFLLEQNLIEQVKDYNADILSIIPHGVYTMIKNGEKGWEKYLPEKLVQIIKENGLFYYKPENVRSLR